jgi:hypothetical protein
MRWIAVPVALMMFALGTGQAWGQKTTLRFEVTRDAARTEGLENGRVLVSIGAKGSARPVFGSGQTGMDAAPVLGRDAQAFAPGKSVTLDQGSAIFPIESLSKLPAGDYAVQALFASNRDLRSLNSARNLFSDPVAVHLDPAKGGTIKLVLTHAVPPEEMPKDTESVKYIKLQSKLLTAFHGRPIYLRAGVVLPLGYAQEPARRYPLRVHIGGFGTRYTAVDRMMREGSGFRRLWATADAPRFLTLVLDGDGPYGDPYQVNSANNGPYGDAVTQELIPEVERLYRGVGQPYARVLDGGSTGAWVSFALQVFYPDFFNGTWPSSPDPLDFRAYELIDIYKDKNAYLNPYGFERASARTLTGDTRFTMRHEVQMENVRGDGDSYAFSGGQWGAWNAVFSPRGADGKPVLLWNPQTGVIDHTVAEQWKKYDMRLYMEANWKTLAPKLRGKIHLWVGEADDYFLNNAVHLLDASLAKADPPFVGEIYYGPGKGHTWYGITDRQILDQMAAATRNPADPN